MSEFLERIAKLDHRRLALLADGLHRRLDEMEAALREPIAIIGVACRFPGGADTPEAFWSRLREGYDAVREVPADRWEVEGLYDPDPDAPGRLATRWAALLDRVDLFDAPFFGISPREAAGMDPQQRLLLELSWEAIERAAIAPEQLMGSATGVFAGIAGNDYAQLGLRAGLAAMDAYTASGAAHSIAVGRISFVLGLQGPCFPIDTACSSSLVAVHQAVQSLRMGECELALAGGVNVILSPETTVALSRAHMMAADGRCRAFDARADGFVRGEGGGMLLLKRLSRARSDGDPIVAVIRGSAINQDGRSNGLTAPNGRAQEALIRAALANAGVEPEEVGFVEAHGTGTSLGDPIEVRALAGALGVRPREPVRIGSVKANIGHLESAAGIAGLVKLVLSVQHGEIPPQIHIETLNPHIPWEELPVVVPMVPEPWSSAGPRVGGVSSFGFSGTNAHILVAEAPPPAYALEAGGAVDRPVHLLTLSARTEGALVQVAERLETHLAGSTTVPEIEDVCFTLGAGRTHMPHRVALPVTSIADAQVRLRAFVSNDPARTHTGEPRKAKRPRVAFLFPGQGCQRLNMGRRLHDLEPTFRDALERCEGLLRSRLERPLTRMLYPAAGDEPEAKRLLQRSRPGQLALFAFEYALLELWRSWGVRPSAVVGHGMGELAAAYCAGILDLETGLKLVEEQTRANHALPDNVGLAFPNGGPHSPDGQADVPAFDTSSHSATTIQCAAPRIPMASTLTGAMLPADRAPEAAHWTRQATAPVHFAEAIRSVRAAGCTHFLEIGPGTALLTLGRESLTEEESVRWLPSITPDGDDWTTVAGTLAALYEDGLDIDWDGFGRHLDRRRIVLPAYPFQRERHWSAPDISWVDEAGPVATSAAAETSVPSAAIESLLFEVAWPLAASEAGSGGQGAMQLLGPGEIGAALSATFAARTQANGLAVYDKMLARLNPLAGRSMAFALQSLGWSMEPADTVTADELAARLGILDRHQRLLRRMLTVLEEDGVVSEATGVWTVLRQPDPTDPAADWADLRADYPALATEVALVSRCAAALPSVLRGEVDPLQLLFPDGTLEEAETLYQETPLARTFNAAIRDAVTLAAGSLDPHQPLRVLEVGGGTGGTTSCILETIPTHGLEYVFTDISPRFTRHARDKFQERSFLRYEVLDISRDPMAQGFAEHSFDLVVAANVVHATVDVRETISHLKRLLAPGGLLVLYEATDPQRFSDLTVGLTTGWWSYTDVDLRPDYALLSHRRWRELLGELGFTDIITIPDETAIGVLAQQTMVLARAPMVELVGGTAVAPPSTADVEPRLPADETEPRPWLVLADAEGFAERVAASMRLNGEEVVLAPDRASLPGPTAGPEVDCDDAGALDALLRMSPAGWRGIVDLRAVNDRTTEGADADGLMAQQRRRVGGALHLVQALARVELRHPSRLWLVTRGAQPVSAEQSSTEAVQAGLWGLGHTIALEHPELRCVRLDLDPDLTDREQQAQICARALIQPEPGEDQIAVRHGQRRVRRLVRSAPEDRVSTARFLADASYLITGAYGGLGLLVAEWMVERGARNLILVGRRTPSAGAAERLARLECSGTTILTAVADVARCDRIKEVLAEAEQAMPPLRGIIHGAGTLDDGVLLRQDWSRFETVLAPKVAGSWNVHMLTRHLPLDFFVLFSSGAGLLGAAGQGNHAAANAFLDALAYYRSAAGLPGLTINWGAWADVGAAAEHRLTGRGVESFSPAEGLAALEFALFRASSPAHLRTRPAAAQLAVLAVDWQQAVDPASGDPPRVLTELAAVTGKTTRSDARPVEQSLLERLAALPPNRRFSAVQSHIREVAAAVLGIADVQRVGIELPLQELGLDSLMAVEMHNRLARAYERPLPATLLFECPTVSALANYLAPEFRPVPPETSESQPAHHLALPANGIARETASSSAPVTEEELAAELLGKLAEIEADLHMTRTHDCT